LAKHSTRTRAGRRYPDFQRYASPAFRPHALAIGQIALAWNELHEVLCAFFASMTATIDEWKIEAAWQSLPSDRAKRGMLKAVFNNLSGEDRRRNPRAQEDMKWLLNQLDRAEEDRNNAVHAPLIMFTTPIWESLGKRIGVVQPDDVRENKRAVNLSNKNLLDEYRNVRDEIIILRCFAEAIEDAWCWSGKQTRTWPDRPRLPNRGQKSRGRARRSNQPKQLPLPLKSSQE
jgi:hypothetical protein